MRRIRGGRNFLEFYDLSLKITPYWCIPLSNLALSRTKGRKTGAQNSCRGAQKKVPDLYLFIYFFRDTKFFRGGKVLSLSGGAPTGNVTPLSVTINFVH